MFNESQHRYLAARLRHIEELLSEGLDRLDAAGGMSLYPHAVPDATPAQRKVLRDYLKQLRFAMRRFIEAYGLGDTTEPVSGLWSLRTAVSFALVAVEELRPKYLRGYGELDGEAAVALERIAAQLGALLNRIGAYLAGGAGGDLAARLAQLDATREETALLRELERVISQRGLVELRTTLEGLIERARTPSLEIAVFGRVNSGKSSLLNWWLGTPLLPTGVIPVTAVPTRIVRGPRAEAEVVLTGARSSRIGIDELPAFITEEGNPGNAKGVIEVLIRAPGERLGDGVVLVDTPGVGSLAAGGAAQTWQYLPRCDLGIVLLEAGAPLSEEDLSIVRALLDGGSEALVALSKADRLSPEESAVALAYAEKALRSEVGIDLPVSAVSTAGSRGDLASAWFEARVAPRLARCREEAAASLRRKIGALRETVVAALEARLRSGPSMSAPVRPSGAEGPGRTLAQARADMDAMRRDLPMLVREVRAHSQALAEAGTRELERCWRESRSADVTLERVQAEIGGRARQIGDRVAAALDALRTRLEEAAAAADDRAGLDSGLREGGESHEGGELRDDLPHPRGLPAGEFSWPAAAGKLRRPPGLLGRRPLSGMLARRRFRREIGESLRGQVGVYGEALRLWALKFLDELGAQFEVIAARLEGLERFAAVPGDSGEEREAMRQELRELREWPTGAGGRGA